jgi:aminopeptidase N
MRREFLIPACEWLLAGVALLSVGCNSSPSTASAPPAAGVPLQLATSRAADIANLRYQLTFSIPASRTEPIAAKETIRFALKDTSRPQAIDFVDRTHTLLSNITVNGRILQLRTTNDHIVIPAERLVSGENVVDIAFVAGDAPLNRNPDFVYSILVPARAHEAFPCFDQPDLKARFSLELLVPPDWQAVANGAETKRESVGDRVRVTFAETQPISTYLFAFAAGKFQIETAERDGRTFRMFHRETDAAKVARNRNAIFDLHASALKWLEDYTTIPYPFGKFDFVAVPSFQFGGMEHPGAIFYNASGILLDESATENQYLNRANVIAHETSHMWFGDLVTMRWFNDVWMKEVFANFMAAKIANPAFPKVNHELRFLVSNYPAAYAVDRTQGTHPIRQELANLDEAGSLYGAIIYQKAPIVMRQLERLIGADTMRDGLRAYLKQFSFGNATWLDLVKTLDDRTDRDLAEWSHVWVEEAGRPLMRTDWETSPEGRRQIAILQRDGRSGRSLHWTEQISVLLGTPDSAREVPLELKTDRTELPDGLAPPEVHFILPGGGGLAYGGVTLDDRSRDFLIGHVEELRDPVARGATWITLWDELLNGLVDPPAFMEAALRALPREDTEQNVQLVSSYLDEIFWRFIGPNTRARVAPLLERTLRTGLQRATSSSLKSTYFTAFRTVVTTADGVAFLERVWKRQEKIPGLILAEPDEATMALELAVRGVPNAQAILAEQRGRFQNPDRKARFEFVMPALSADEATRDTFFKSLSDVANRRREPWATEGLHYLNHPRRSAHAVSYIRPALDLLHEIQQTGDIFFPKNWMDALLDGHNSREAVDIVRGFLDAHPQPDPASPSTEPAYPVRLRRIILQAADDLFRAPDIVVPGS